MSELAKQFSSELGIDDETAEQVADYVTQNLDGITKLIQTERAEDAAAGHDVPTESSEDTPGRADDDESWVLRQADSC